MPRNSDNSGRAISILVSHPGRVKFYKVLLPCRQLRYVWFPFPCRNFRASIDTAGPDAWATFLRRAGAISDDVLWVQQGRPSRWNEPPVARSLSPKQAVCQQILPPTPLRLTTATIPLDNSLVHYPLLESTYSSS